MPSDLLVHIEDEGSVHSSRGRVFHRNEATVGAEFRWKTQFYM